MSETIVVIVQPQTIATVEVGVQGPVGPAGSCHTEFATAEAMFATIGNVGQTAYCLDNPDQHWKWSSLQTKADGTPGTWIPAF
jgi:hypothetical protein